MRSAQQALVSILVALLAHVAAAASTLTTASCVMQNGTPKITFGSVSSAAYAWASFNDTLDLLGWGTLHVHTTPQPGVSDEDTLYCAGFVEGALTHTRMWQNFNIYKVSWLEEFGTSDWPESLVQYMEDNIYYTQTMTSMNKEADPWWRQTNFVVTRTLAILDGYNQYRATDEPEISEVDMWIYQSAGDMDDISLFIDPSNWYTNSAGARHITPPDAAWHDVHHHCSGLVALPSTYEDVFFAQASWSALNTMNRVLKEYDFQITDSDTVCHKETLASHPGLGYSMDDFWELDTDMLVLETTMNNFNMTLYEESCVPESVLCWIRVQVANWLSADGKTWVTNFIRENSGTYNNQYFVLDLKKFTPNQKPLSGFLWTIEQLPGFYEMGDRTPELLTNGYVPSYNTPFFTAVYDMAGYPEEVAETESGYWSYWNNSRMLITQRDCPEKCQTYDGFKSFMRYNDWQNDPLSYNDPSESILARYDLRPDSCVPSGTMMMCPSAFGGIDAKTTNYALAKTLSFDAISSPQYETQPAWEFGVGKWADVMWDGLPQLWEFPWTQFAPDN